MTRGPYAPPDPRYLLGWYDGTGTWQEEPYEDLGALRQWATRTTVRPLYVLYPGDQDWRDFDPGPLAQGLVDGHWQTFLTLQGLASHDYMRDLSDIRDSWEDYLLAVSPPWLARAQALDGPPAPDLQPVRLSGYWPATSAAELPEEGGPHDRRSRPLYSLQDYLAGKAPYVSLAGDYSVWPYGGAVWIPELEAKYGKAIDFRVVDALHADWTRRGHGVGPGRLDVRTASRRDGLDDSVNGDAHYVRLGRATADVA